MLYHERQDAALCGLHTLNNLLQGHFVNEIDLMMIAQELDAAERSVMGEHGTGTMDFIKFIAEDSGNVALDGNFSIQVLSTALKTFEITCESIKHETMADALNNPEREEGFICNLQSHWFAIRKLNGTFWNLNSLQKRPSTLSDLYLGAFLFQLEQEGYTIFVIRGKFPPSLFDENDHSWTFVQDPKQPQFTEDDEMAMAIKASLADQHIDDDLEMAIKFSMETNQNSFSTQDLVIPDEPSADSPNISQILIRLPGGKSIKRNFNNVDKISDVFKWVLYETKTIDLFGSQYHLKSNFPPATYDNPNLTLQECNLSGRIALTISEQ
jgi:ataxin-3